MTHADRAPRLVRSAVAVAAVSFVTLLLTVAWQMAIARWFGASAELDAFWVALALPRAIAESFHLGLLTLLFVLVFRPDSGGENDHWRRASAVLNVTLIATAVCVSGLVAAAPLLVRWMAPGLSPATLDMAATMLRQLAWFLIPTAIAAALGGTAIARSQLMPFTVSRAAMPALQLIVLFALAASLGVRALAWSMMVGAVGAVVVLIAWLKRLAPRYYVTLHWSDPETRRLVTMQGVLAACWVVILLNQVVDRYLASLLGPGSVSALEYAWRFEIPIAQIVSLGVALPTFALLAQRAGADQREEFRATLAQSARLLVMSVVPMIGFLIVLREPLARLWFERGSFLAADSDRVTMLLPPLAVVFFCRAFASILLFGLLTVGRHRLLLAGLVAELVLHAVLGTVLSQTLGLQGVVIASAAAMALTNGALWMVLLSDVGGVALGRTFINAGRLLAASAIAIALLEAARRAWWHSISDGLALSSLVPLAIAGAAYLTIYVALLCVGTGVFQPRGLRLPVAARSLK
jgi:putative peptidoglycan lipid II flippase